MEAYSMTVAERSELLDKLRWARELDWPQIEQLARFLLVFTVKKDEAIFREGDQAPCLGLIAAGRVRVVKEDSANDPKKIALLGPGDTFGEMSLIDGEPRSASVFANEDTMLFFLTKENFFSLLDEYPQIGNKLLMTIAKLMSQRLRKTSGWLVEALSESHADAPPSE